MNSLSVVIILFVFLECLNVLLLYFFPESTKGNSMGFFKAYEKSKSDPDVHALVKYLINWVAGTKIIFIALLIVILVIGDDTMKLYSVIVLILTIAVFYWRLFPAIRKMDKNKQISPKGYSKTLGIMIAGFELVFLVGMVVHLIG